MLIPVVVSHLCKKYVTAIKHEKESVENLEKLSKEVEEHLPGNVATWAEDKAAWEAEVLKSSDPASGSIKKSTDVNCPYEAKRPEGK